MNNIRQYTDQDWAVRRWDRLNKGKPVEPKSFCQFWRGVLLWATLASIPIVGRMYLVRLQVMPTIAELRVKQEAFDRRLNRAKRIGRPLVRIVWLMLWPVRQLCYRLGRVVVWAVALVDDNIRGRTMPQWIDRTVKVLATLIIVIWVGGLGLAFVLLAIEAWRTSWPVFLAIGFGIPLTIAGVVLIVKHYGDAICGGASMLWGLAVASKHRICPLIQIRRG